MTKSILAACLLACLLGLALILVITPAPAQTMGQMPGHPTPESHAYPWECCSGRDCMPVPPSAVKFSPEGITIVKTGEFLPFGDDRIKFLPEDPTNGFHWCRYLTGPNKERTICLFIPEGGA